MIGGGRRRRRRRRRREIGLDNQCQLVWPWNDNKAGQRGEEGEEGEGGEGAEEGEGEEEGEVQQQKRPALLHKGFVAGLQVPAYGYQLSHYHTTCVAYHVYV